MSKSNLIKKHKESELVDDFDLSDFLDSPGDEAVAGVLQGLIEASNNQMTLAIELTKLIVNKNANNTMNEDDIFGILKKSTKVIAENFPLKTLLEEFSSKR